jgi:hypothetical protein
LSLPHCGAPPACAANEDDNDRLLHGDPLLDWSPWASGAGCFGAAEVDIVGPAVKHRLNSLVNLGGVPTIVSLPSAELNWTAIPRVELGYRLGQATGEFMMVYRGLYTSGSGSIAAFDAAGNTADLRSHLHLNVIDLDYASRENSLGPLWDMKWRTGARIATVFFDSTATAPLLSERETNNFVAAGLHFGLNLKRRLGDTGFALVGDIDTGVVLGAVHQEFSAAMPGTSSDIPRSRATEPAPMLEVRFGVAYAPQLLPNLRLSTGYVFERWWAVGETPLTQGEITYQGVFLRGEWRY